MINAGRKPRKLLWKLTVSNVVFLLLLYLGETLIAERHWLTTLITYAPQQLLGVPTVLLLLYSIARRRWRILAVNAVAAIFFAFAMLGLSIPFGAYTRLSGPRICVMTYNINHASKGAEQIAENVRRIGPDIVCFQETNLVEHLPDPVVELKRVLPGWYSASDGQLAVFSRYPISECVIHRPLAEYWRVFLEVTVLVKGRRLTVIDLHLNTAAEPASLTDHRGSMAAYLRGSTGARATQISELLKIATHITGPLIVAGDFNTPPRGRIYSRMAGRFRDTFRASGWGFGYSYRSNLPLMRIDYVFAGKGLHPVRCAAPALAGSDHRPVVADISFTK